MYVKIWLLSYQFFQKLKRLKNCKFNHLIIILILLLRYGPKSSFNKYNPICEIFNILNERYSKARDQTYDFLL